MECLVIKHQSNKNFSSKYCKYAACYGKLPFVNFFHENDYEWDQESCNEASYGHIDCLKYLVSNGCSLDDRSFFYARNNNSECFEYLKDVLMNEEFKEFYRLDDNGNDICVGIDGEEESNDDDN